MVIAGLCGGLDGAGENRFGVPSSAFHDAACALVENGELTAALEEERVSRIKHTNTCPLPALGRCLHARGLTIADVDAFAFAVRESYLDEVVADRYARARSLGRQCGRQYLQRLVEETFGVRPDPARFHFVDHHLAHACSAFYPSGFDQALVFTADGVGDSLSGTIYLATGSRLELLHTFPEEDSLGFFYLHVTRYLGFDLFDEYKVMGLAPYGDGDRFAPVFADLYTLRPDGTYCFHARKLSALWERLPRRAPGAGFTQSDMDVAMAAQLTLQRIVRHVLTHYQRLTGLEHLCLAGGVALNCRMNGELLRHGPFRHVFVQPAAHDGGLSVGAALQVHHRSQPCPAPRARLRQVYLGGDVGSPREIESLLGRWERFVEWEHVDDPYAVAAQLLGDGTILGWARGRSEFGPRALGNRSILADPRPAAHKDIINALVKKREAFRPFAPSVLEEYAAEYFELSEHETSFPFMLVTVPVRERYRPLLGAVTHVDGSARVQTVSRCDNPGYWRLIDAFRERTGVPVLLNTSFNNFAEPIVETAADCLVCFITTGLPVLVLDRFIVRKRPRTAEALLSAVLGVPAYAKLHDTPPPETQAPPTRAGRRSWWRTLRARFDRAPVAGASLPPVRVVGNTFDSREYPVSDDVFRLLRRCDGYRRIGELMDDAGMKDEPARRACLAAIEDLWERRLVSVHP